MSLSNGTTPTVTIKTSKRAMNMYSIASLEHFCNKFDVPITDNPEEADFIWFSCCDPDDLNTLIKLRNDYPDKGLIMGGFEAYFAIPYFAWIDYAVLGSGYNFIKKWGQDYKEALKLDCVMEGPEDETVPDYHVPFQEYPLLKMPGRNKYFYLAGKGCRRKCKFCATSWVQPHQEASKVLVKKVLRKVEQENYGNINLVCNDSSRVYKSSAINAQSVRVEDYLENPSRYKSNMLHFGIEGWTEEKRREWNKPVSNANIRKLLEVTKKQKQKCELFFIVGYEGWNMDKVRQFAEKCLPLETKQSPTIHVKLTYIDYMAHTPLYDGVVNPNHCSPDKVFKIMSGFNQRVRTFPTRSMARSAWRTVLRRSNPAEAVRINKEPTDTNKNGEKSFIKYRKILQDKNLEYRLHTPNKYYDNIKTRIKK